MLSWNRSVRTTTSRNECLRRGSVQPAIWFALLLAALGSGLIVWTQARAGAHETRRPALKLDDLALSGLNDLQARVKVAKADQTELAKINKDYGLAYRLKDLTLRYKEPNKLRMDGSIGRMIMNGSTRFFQVPALRLTKKDELGDTPGKQYTLVDIGLLTKSGVAKVQDKFLRNENLDGAETGVFDISYRGGDASHYTLWVDTKTHVVLKREWYDAGGKKRATFLYREPKEAAPGVWLPTRIEILNSEGAVAAITDYSDVKVNQGLDDALFNIQ